MTVLQSYPFTSRSHFWEVMVSSQPITLYVKIDFFFLRAFVCTEYLFFSSHYCQHYKIFLNIPYLAFLLTFLSNLVPSADFVPSLFTFVFSDHLWICWIAQISTGFSVMTYLYCEHWPFNSVLCSQCQLVIYWCEHLPFCSRIFYFLKGFWEWTLLNPFSTPKQVISAGSPGFSY